METNLSASIAVDIASALLVDHKKTGSRSFPNYKIRTIIEAASFDPKKLERILHLYYLGYIDVVIDVSELDGPAYRLTKNKPS